MTEDLVEKWKDLLPTEVPESVKGRFTLESFRRMAARMLENQARYMEEGKMEAKDLTYIVRPVGDEQWSALPVEHRFHDFMGVGETPEEALRNAVGIVDGAIESGHLAENDLATDVTVVIHRSSYTGVPPDVERYFKGDE